MEVRQAGGQSQADYSASIPPSQAFSWATDGRFGAKSRYRISAVFEKC